jgi:hypothetical protein
MKRAINRLLRLILPSYDLAGRELDELIKALRKAKEKKQINQLSRE